MDQGIMTDGRLRDRIVDEDDFVVFDIEIRKSPDEVEGGWEAKDRLGFACAVAWVEAEGRFRLFDEGNAQELVELLSGAPLVVGFNHIRFDYKVMHMSDDLTPARPCIPVGFDEGKWPEIVAPGLIDFDILLEIWKAVGVGPEFSPATHGKYGLDSVASHTLGPRYRKTGHGAHAPKLYQDGKWAELFDYCQQDVRLTRDLFRFIRERGYVSTERGLVQF